MQPARDRLRLNLQPQTIKRRGIRKFQRAVYAQCQEASREGGEKADVWDESPGQIRHLAKVNEPITLPDQAYDHESQVRCPEGPGSAPQEAAGKSLNGDGT